MTTQTFVAEAILACKPLAARYLAGFTDENHTRQAPGLPNHVAWSLGHCAMTMHRASEKIDGKPLPQGDFVPGMVSDGARYAVETVAFGSKPADDRTLYPPMARCVAVYEAACERLAHAVQHASDSKLAEKTAWGVGETTLGLLAMRLIFHNGMHTGQIADLRRALGFKSIFS